MNEEAQVEETGIKTETRIDEFSVSMFAAMGYKELLSDNMIMVYKSFKSRKDKMQAGRLTPEGFAAVAVIGDMFDGLIKPISGVPELEE